MINAINLFSHAPIRCGGEAMILSFPPSSRSTPDLYGCFPLVNILAIQIAFCFGDDRVPKERFQKRYLMRLSNDVGVLKSLNLAHVTFIRLPTMRDSA